ncbi:RNA 3'-terminal phosphate cyclase domain-containing protein [Massariosphaeria phaeospora]|uniref:RNA 3'-terminal phosphate cyclase domain-containing protein n=1 Tax=Massariosphaeria phaeospora TaxID=100035 RepID=A0A7C8I399_9PLEO|nr:RNA 3'-terminal phosphate cyclase domain-containing protein [Massariosphaeria phaeospora]
MATLVHLEGTTLEGGGQLLRIALGLSSLTGIPIRITNIRGKRSRGGGLKAQHLTSVQWLGRASNAQLTGAELKSKEITFTPSTDDIFKWSSDVQISQSTPGSINLVLQAILPYLLFSGAKKRMKLRITGGTNVSNSPSYDYVTQVLLPMLAHIGIPPIQSDLHSRGWSQGSNSLGSVTYTIKPLTKPLPSFQLTKRGTIQSVQATILAPKSYEQQIRDELNLMFEKREEAIFGEREPEIGITFEDSRHDKRFYLLLVATSTTGIKLGRDWLYDHGVRAGKIDAVISNLVKKVAGDLIGEIEHGGCVDEYLRDQLVVYQALARGQSRVDGGRSNRVLKEPSLHTQTAQWVVGELIGVQFDEEGSCDGIGFDSGRKIDGERNEEEKELVKGLEKLAVGPPEEK